MDIIDEIMEGGLVPEDDDERVEVPRNTLQRSELQDAIYRPSC